VRGFIIDASIAVKWVVEEPGTKEALALRACPLGAPELLVAECANILWKKVRRRELTGEECEISAKNAPHARRYGIDFIMYIPAKWGQT